MARGLCFGITDDIKVALNGVAVEEGDLYGLIPTIAESVSDVAEEAKEGNLRILADMLNSYGCESQLHTGEGVCFLSFKLSLEFARSYFRDRFMVFKETAEAMELDEFARDCYTVSNLLENRWGDAVYYNGGFYTLDRFIRESSVDVVYYCNSVVLMH